MPASSDSARAWVVTADMGLGHQRAAHAPTPIAKDRVLSAGSPEPTDAGELRSCQRLTRSYESRSRTRNVRMLGDTRFGSPDAPLHIPPFHRLRDLSNPSPNNLEMDHLAWQGLGRSLLARLSTERRPLIAGFYAPASRSGSG